MNPVTDVKLVIYCDDFLVWGNGVESAKFLTSLESRFDCRLGFRQVLTPNNPIKFTGVRVSMVRESTTDQYYMDQSEDIARFLSEHDMHDVKCRGSPMSEAAELYSSSELLSEE